MGASSREFLEQREYAMLDCLSVEELRNNVIVEEGVNYDFIENYQSIFLKVENGTITACEGYALINEIENDFKKKKEIISCLALEESELHPKNFALAGFKFERRNGKATYNFKGLQSWNDAKSKLKAIEDLSKQAFSNYKKGLKVDIIDENGEVVQLPKVTYSSDILIVKALD